MTDNRSRLQIKIIGPYECLEDRIIGRGANSVVFEGRRLSSKLKVCIKRIDLSNSTLQRFAQAEIQVLRRVSHSNIVGFLGYFERGSSIYIVTELCDMNLHEKVKKEFKLEERQALRLFLQILEGYQALRNRGFIHRDIKPENILLHNNSAKLADFGYSLLLNSASVYESFNIGSPLYMAPEALLSNLYSQKSDIWSLGVTLYEMIFGSPPFSSKSEEGLKRQIREPVSQLRDQTISQKIIKNCLCIEQEGRYDLQRLLLQVKVALHNLSQPQNPKKQPTNMGRGAVCFLNELNYIRFLDYIKFLAQHTASLKSEIKDRIIYLFEYTIRIRIHSLDKYIKEEGVQILPGRLIDSLSQIRRQHDSRIDRPSDLGPNDRLLFFEGQKPAFKKSIQWQIQAELKNLIRKMINMVGSRLTEYSACVNEQMIKLVDFLLSAFLLNKILIQKENCSQQFAKVSHLRTILSAPCRITPQVWEKVLAKAVELQISQ